MKNKPTRHKAENTFKVYKNFFVTKLKYVFFLVHTIFGENSKYRH